jgi:hypothetical protein
MLYAIEQYELQFLSVSKKIGKPPTDGWSPPLIDVWKNHDTFRFEVCMDRGGGGGGKEIKKYIN